MSGPLSDILKAKFADALTVPEAAAVPELVLVAPGALRDVCRCCRDDAALDLQVLSCLSGVDYADRIELVYHLISYRRKHELVLKVSLDRASPRVSTVEGVWKTADWHERECYDLLGVTFEDHPDLRHLLLPDDWVGYPLRKDYEPPTEYHGIPHSRIDPLRPVAPAAASTPGSEVPRAH
jgi:NADH-quinone oxidoreductase subunit C